MEVEMFEDVLRELRKMESGAKITINLELDDKGYLDRRCSSVECGALFKVMFEDWKDIVQDNVVYCPFCRHDAVSSEWNTSEQAEYISKAAMAHVQDKLGRAFQSGSRKFNACQSRNSFIQMRMSYKPGSLPIPVPASATEIMTQEFKCEECDCRYASIGAAFFCPACGNNSILDTFANSIETVKKTVSAIPVIRDSIRHICENGLVKIVSSFQSYVEACFSKLPNSSQFNVRPNLFQNLAESDSLWRNATSRGYKEILSATEYQLLAMYFQQRHLLAHKDGMIDQQYIDRSDDHRFDVGQRLIVTESNVSELAAIVDKLARRIAALP
jgi:hypothetical protein